MSTTREDVVVTTRRIIELLLVQGIDSYEDDLREEYGRPVVVSPFAAEAEVTISEQGHMLVGPWNEDAGNFYYTSSLVCNGKRVEAYGEVSCDERGPFLVQARIYFDDTWLSRNVSVRHGVPYDLWGSPEGYDFTSALSKVVRITA